MQMLAMCQERKKQKSSLMLTRKERISACVAELQKLEQQQERYRQEKFRAYEDYSGGTLAKDAYLRQRADIDGKLAAAKAEQEVRNSFYLNWSIWPFRIRRRRMMCSIPLPGQRN